MHNKAYLKGYNQLVKQHSNMNVLSKSKIEETINKRANLIKKSNINESFKDTNVSNSIYSNGNKKTITYTSPKAKNSKFNTITNTLTLNNTNIINNISSVNPRSNSRSKEKNQRTETDHHCSYFDTEQCEEDQSKQINYTHNKVY